MVQSEDEAAHLPPPQGYHITISPAAPAVTQRAEIAQRLAVCKVMGQRRNMALMDRIEAVGIRDRRGTHAPGAAYPVDQLQVNSADMVGAFAACGEVVTQATLDGGWLTDNLWPNGQRLVLSGGGRDALPARLELTTDGVKEESA
jgi:hypothetical protein